MFNTKRKFINIIFFSLFISVFKITPINNKIKTIKIGDSSLFLHVND